MLERTGDISGPARARSVLELGWLVDLSVYFMLIMQNLVDTCPFKAIESPDTWLMNELSHTLLQFNPGMEINSVVRSHMSFYI